MDSGNNGINMAPGFQQQWSGPPKPMPVQSGKVRIFELVLIIMWSLHLFRMFMLFFQTFQMYPPDQPMIFNPQNPNAPPIYPCGVCHKEVHDNDQAIPCESGCNFWFHRYQSFGWYRYSIFLLKLYIYLCYFHCVNWCFRICTGLTEGAYHFLTQEVYAEWVCEKCVATKNVPLVKFKP